MIQLPGYSGRGRPPKRLYQLSGLTPETTPGGSKSGGTTPSPGKRRRGKSSRSSRLDKLALAGSSPNVSLSEDSVALTAQQLGSEPLTGNLPSVTILSTALSQSLDTLNYRLSDALRRVLPENCAVVEHESKPAAWFFHDGVIGLLLEWNVDAGHYGSYTVKLVGMSGDKPLTMKINARDEILEFHGDISVKGSGTNDLFASFGPDDANVLDHEGTVVNKPRCIVIAPKRND